ncbi:MAG: ATP-binding cassette domain-containing protein [Actinomycetota bacterium]|nr:ATP-binding cassette domain-containing protein [Actinomycetota bacterium]
MRNRAELVVPLALIVVLAVLPSGLPVGIAGTGAVAGAVLSLQAVGMIVVYTRTKILSSAQFGLGAAAAVLFFLWVQYNQWAVLADGLCGCLAPAGRSISALQHQPDAYRDYLSQQHPFVIVANAILSGALAVALASDTGVRTYRFIAKVFARAPRIVPTVATFAFAFALSSGAAALLVARGATVFGWHLFSWFPYGPRAGSGINGAPAQAEGHFVPPYADAWGFRLDSGVRFHLYDVLAVATALVALVAVTLLFARGRRGLVSRAVADNLERAATLGLDVQVHSERPWRVAGALSGLGGVLTVTMSQQPAVGLDLPGITLALAAVVLARMSSPAVAVLASVLLGVIDQGMFWNFGSHVEFQGSLVLIIGAALVLQRGRQTRAELSAASVFTTAPEPTRVPAGIRRARGVRGLYRAVGLTTGVLVLGYPFATTPSQLSQGTVLLPYMLIGLSLLVLSGWAGQVSLGQFAFAAVGAYVAVVAGVHGHLPLPVALLAGAVAAALVAPLVGLPALRLPGPFVVIMTLAFSLAVPAVLLNPDLLGTALPGAVHRPVVLGLDLASDRSLYYVSLVVLSLALGFVAGLRRSRLRRALIASRENELAAKAMGIDTLRLRITGFSLGGGLAGLGGGLLAYANGSVQAQSFSAENSVLIFLIVVVGGLSTTSGPLLGGLAYGIAQLAGAAWLAALNGLGTLLILVVRPGGLASIVFAVRDSAIRVILHLQGVDLARTRNTDGTSRIAIADRGARAAVVPFLYRYAGTGYGPVEGTRLRPGLEVPDAIRRGIDPVVASEGSPPGTEEPLLVLARGEVAYEGIRAVSGVTLQLQPGEILAVVGTNGAGKTSLLRALAGLEPWAHGELRFRGEDITSANAHARALSGLAFVPGGSSVLPTLTVRQNLELACWELPQEQTALEIAAFLELFPVLTARLNTPAGNLSGGEQQVLAVVQGMLRRPQVLLIDELSLGLSAEVLEALLGRLEMLSLEGTAVILVEQSISRAMTIADTALFLDRGRVRFHGPAEELRTHPELFAAVAFGAGGAATPGSASEVSRARFLASSADTREPVLEVDAVSAGYGDVLAVSDVSLALTAGEVVGILGPNGAGKTSVFDCLSGTLAVRLGRVRLLGTDITTLPTHKRAAMGLMRSYQNVKLFPSLTVRDTIAVALETRLKVKGALAAGLWLPASRAEERRADERVDILLELLKLQGCSEALVGSLSLGSRRLVDLACQLAARPKVLLLDEPTSGMAQSETESLGPLIRRVSKDLDCAVLIVEHNVAVLSSVADRLVAMSFGAVIADGAPHEVLSDAAVRAAYFAAATSRLTKPATELVPSA